MYLPTEVAVVGLAVARIFATVESTAGRIAASALGLFVIVGTTLLPLIFLHRARLVIDSARVRYVGLLKSRAVTRSNVRTVIRWTDTTFGNSPSDRATLLVLGRDKPAFVLDGALWGEAVLDDLATALDVPTERFNNATDAAVRYRSAIPWRDRHPIGLVFLIVAAVILLAMIVALPGS